jgi:hypothetical protein
VAFSVDYPDRPLNRLTTGFRLIVDPILIVALPWRRGIGSYNAGGEPGPGAEAGRRGPGSGAAADDPVPQKYPRWWFDWNLEVMRFENRIAAFLALMDDRYPSTDEHQSVQLEFPYPDVQRDLNRWLPLVKWLLAIPHYIVLLFLWLAALVCVIIAWFAILFTGRYPRGLFDFVLGVFRWGNRVIAYAFVLVTDEYPPFRLAP